MDWVAPPRGSPGDRALDWLGGLRRADWAGTARASGMSQAGVRRLAGDAARGGDPRVAWYREELEAEGSSPPKKGRVSRSEARAKAARAYELKRGGGRWEWIAEQCGYSTARGGLSAYISAKRYAEKEGLPWPVTRTG